MVGGPPPPKGVQLSMPPVVPIEPHEDLGACRYGGPYKQPKLIKDAKRITSTVTDKPLFEIVPVEIIYEIISNLSKEDLRNISLCNRALNEIIAPILYKRSKLSTLKLFVWSEDQDLPKDYAANVFLDPGKNKKADKRFSDFFAKLPIGKYASLVRGLEILGIDSRTWQFGHELLRRFPGVSDMDFPWLTCHRELSFGEPAPLPQEPKDSKGVLLDSEEQRVERLIAEFGETAMKNISQVSFDWTSIGTLRKILSHLPKLERFTTSIPDPMDTQRALPDRYYRQIVPTIAATVGSTLVRLDLRRQPTLAHIDGFFKLLGDRSKFPSLKIFNVTHLPMTLDERTSQLERAKFLYETCRASERHGRWIFPHKNLHVGVLEMAELEAEEIRTLYVWLTKNIPKWNGEFLMEEIGFLNSEAIPDFERFFEKMKKISDTVPLKLRIDSIFPPSTKNGILPIMKKFASRLVQLTLSPSEIDPSGEVEDVDLIASTVQIASKEWRNFLETILPLCKNMHTLRTISRIGGDGVDIQLGETEKSLATLCRVHKLRHLDIDISSLPQSESLFRSALRDRDGPGDAPRPAIRELAWISTPHGSMMKPNFKNCLQNLRSLKMRNLFILRRIEMVWFTNLTAKLKNLELVEVQGLVWHIGYEHGLADSEDDDDADKGKDGAKDDEDEEWQDSEFGDDDEIPSMKEVSEQIGKLSLVNRLDVDSSLLAWLPDDSESDSDSESEVEGDKQGKIDDDGDDTRSVDSDFGSDPRFSETVNEELHVARLKGWICKVLIATAKKTGGRCRKVIIKDLRIDAKGLDPWSLDDSFSLYDDISEDEDEW